MGGNSILLSHRARTYFKILFVIAGKKITRIYDIICQSTITLGSHTYFPCVQFPRVSVDLHPPVLPLRHTILLWVVKYCSIFCYSFDNILIALLFTCLLLIFLGRSSPTTSTPGFFSFYWRPTEILRTLRREPDISLRATFLPPTPLTSHFRFQPVSSASGVSDGRISTSAWTARNSLPGTPWASPGTTGSSRREGPPGPARRTPQLSWNSTTSGRDRFRHNLSGLYYDYSTGSVRWWRKGLARMKRRGLYHLYRSKRVGWD